MPIRTRRGVFPRGMASSRSRLNEADHPPMRKRVAHSGGFLPPPPLQKGVTFARDWLAQLPILQERECPRIIILTI